MKILMDILLFTALSIGITAVAVASKFYKWTDENGVTHYSAVAPQGKESDTLDIRTGEKRPATHGTGSDAAKPPAPAERKSKAVKATEKSEKELKAAQQKEIARQAQREKNCETARKNAEILRTRARVRVNDADTGELRYLSPDEKKAREEATAKNIEENCG